MTEKITGYTLLLVGIVTIFLASLSAYSVFTKKAEPVQLFNFSGISINLGNLLEAPDGASQSERAAIEAQKAKVKPTELVSADMINQTSNLGAHIILMGFIVTVGYKISSLGIELLRPVKVNLREAKEEKKV